MLNGVFMIDVKGIQTHHCRKTHQIVKPFAKHKDDREALALQCYSKKCLLRVLVLSSQMSCKLALMSISLLIGQGHKSL